MKGISQVLATVVVLGIAMGIASLYATWAPGFAKNLAQNTTERSEGNIRCSNTALSVDDASYDMTGEVLRFRVSNEGTIRLEDNIYATAINDSAIVGRTELEGLGVGEERYTSIDTGSVPGKLLVTIQECPEVEASTSIIDVSR